MWKCENTEKLPKQNRDSCVDIRSPELWMSKWMLIMLHGFFGKNGCFLKKKKKRNIVSFTKWDQTNFRNIIKIEMINFCMDLSLIDINLSGSLIKRGRQLFSD